MRPNYGIDAPGLLIGFALAAASLLALGTGLAFGLDGPWGHRLAGLCFVIALYPSGMATLMLYDSLKTKITTAEMLLSQLNWTGAEAVLDIGCGRGLMLIAAARRLTTGHATGLDLWRAQDQARNSPAHTMANARAEGIADKVTITTGDMRHLPYANNSFDVVVSNWVLHNLDTPQDRARSMAEMCRVLRPGGSLILSDIANRAEYHTALQALGLTGLRIIVASHWRDMLLKTVSFGSYQPAALIGQRPKVAMPWPP